jgi:iron complex outermembrane recepter protein
MKNSWIALLLLFSVSAFSQKGSISGNVIDGTTKQSVDFAVVALLSAKDSSSITGSMTEPGGKFAFKNLNIGNYILRITFIGYDKKFINVSLSASKPDVVLSNTTLDVSSVNLKTVTITGEKPMIENKIDRKVFNVGESVMASSGTATDILKQVPSVTVDIDGNISLRGSENVVILINGKPSALSGDSRAAVLQQLPANIIENIEVITNPSAKYDPDGVTGIININLKKNARMGANGNVTFNAGTNNKYNGQATLNYNTGKLNVSGSYSGRYDYRLANGTTNRVNWDTLNSERIANSDTSIHQVTRSYDRGYSHMGRLGLDYTINDKTSLGYLGSFLYRGNHDVDATNSINKDYQKITIDSSHQTFDQVAHGINADNNLNLTHKFNNPGEDLKINFTRSDSRNDQLNNTKDHHFFNNMENNKRDKQLSSDGLTSLQADYSLPVNDKIVFETGLKSILEKIDNNLTTDNLIDSTWVQNNTLTNHFIYKSQIHSAYGTWKQEMGSFGYQAGLRAEYFSRDFQYINTGEHRGKDFYNLYPTLHLQQKIDDHNEFVLSYSRRVNRPGSFQLNPFPRYQNAKMFTTGNPALNPEYINSYSFGHLLKWNKNTITTDLFYRQTTNQITMIQIPVPGTDIMQRTFYNLNSSTSYGVDLTAIYYINKWWNLNMNGSVYNQSIDASNLNYGISHRRGTLYNAKIISTVSVPGNYSFQLSGFYRSGMLTPQGTMKAFYSADAGIRKDVLKGKGTLTFTISDIFKTMRFAMTSGDLTFNQDQLRTRESRIVFLGFTYRFGQVIQQKPKDKPDQSNPDDSNQMNQMF